MKYKCVVSDLDWTLLKGDSDLDEKTRGALITLSKNNVLFVPATGRAFKSVPECILSIPGVDNVITSNGVAIYDVLSKKPVMSTHLSVSAVETILKEARKENYILEAFISGQPFTCKAYYDDPMKYGAKEESVAYVQRTRTVVDDMYSFVEENKDRLDCIDVITTPETKAAKLAHLKMLLPNNYITTSAPQLIEISDGNSGKHRRMKDLMDRLGIDLSQVVAFGDGDNDSDMLKMAGYGVAMGNGTAKCQASANYITDTNENLGVYKALRMLFPEVL